MEREGTLGEVIEICIGMRGFHGGRREDVWGVGGGYGGEDEMMEYIKSS